MTPIPIGDPDTALALALRYNLKGKIGLQHDEIVVPVSLMADLVPAPPEMVVELVEASAVAGAVAEGVGSAPNPGFRRQLRHVCLSTRFTADAAPGDMASASAILVAPFTNAIIHGALLEAGTAPFTNANMEKASGLDVNISFVHDATVNLLRVRSDARGSSVGTGARLWYYFFDEPL